MKHYFSSAAFLSIEILLPYYFFFTRYQSYTKTTFDAFRTKKKALYGVFFLSFFFIAKCRLNVFNYIQVIRSNVSVDKELFDT